MTTLGHGRRLWLELSWLGMRRHFSIFQEIEAADNGGNDDRGRDGSAKVTVVSEISPYHPFIEAAQAPSYPLNPDYGGET
jgi:hypothetical protein